MKGILWKSLGRDSDGSESDLPVMERQQSVERDGDLLWNRDQLSSSIAGEDSSLCQDSKETRYWSDHRSAGWQPILQGL